MLYRLSGQLADGNRFSARIEAPDLISAIGAARSAFAESNVEAGDIARLSVRPARGGKTLRISAPRAKAPKADEGETEHKPRKSGKKVA